MPQITKDPLGNDVELLNLTEWSGKNNKELNEDTLTEYAGYATGQMLRAGQKPEEFQNSLYSGLFERGMREGVFQPQDEQQTTQLFESFANKPFVNDATDLDLVSKDLVSVDSEQAAKAADVYQRLQSGQQDPSLDTDLEDVRANVATLDKVQQARINFAKERGLAFIDYPTNEPGRRDVWVNTQAVPDRKAVYDTLDLARGIVDPRSAMLAEEYLKTDPGRTVNRAEQKVNWEIQSLIGKSDPNSELLKRLGTAIEWGSEAAEDKGVASTGAEMLKKAPTDTVTTPVEDVKVSIAPGPMGGMPIYTSKTGEAPIQKVDSNRIADAVIKNAYKALKEEEPNNPLITEYTEEQFLNAARDFVVQRLNVDTNQDDPTKNFVSLSDGTRVPFGSASLLPKEKFNSAMDNLGFDEKERAVAAATRTGWIAANIDDIEQTLHDFEGSEYMDFVQNNRGQYENDRTKIAEAYIDNMKPSVWKTFWAKSRGVLRSVWNASYDVGSTLGLGLAKATNWDFAEQAYKDSLIASAENEKRRGMFVGMYGGDMGMGYTIASQAAPLLTDILITKGAATLTKKGAKSVVTTGIRKTEDLFGTSAKSFIKDSLSEETRGLVGKYLTQFAIGGAEKSPARMLSAVRRDLERKFVAGTATATQIGTSFTRSAQNAWTNTTLRMSKETNADGTPKYTDEQINDAATTSALYSGFATALTERGFGKVFGEGADVTTVGAANIRQLKAYSKRLGGALERGGFGGTELYDTFKQISKEIVREGYGKAAVQIPGEALEEFTDEFTQNVIQSLLGDDTITIKQAFEQSLQAAVVGGVYGGAFGSTNKIGLFKADIARDTATGTAQSIQREMLDRTIARLKESGNTDQTIAALQDRMRVSQRRDLPVSESIPERAAKQTIIDELDSLSEEPFAVPTPPAAPETPPANTTVTRLAAKRAAELGVTEQELKTIQPSGEKNGAPQVTPNDVVAYVNRRTEQMGLDLTGFLPGPDVTEPVDGFQVIGTDNVEDPQDRTFNDLKNRVVIIDGQRGKVRIKDEGVILEPEDGSTPFELTPNKDLPIKDLEGFNTLLQESAAVSPRRRGDIEDPQDRTFNDLKNRVVIIDGMRGRVRVEDEGVILDPEDGSTPFELTPNKDLPIKDFEGFNTLLQESAAVSPRRQPREVSDVKDDGQILYGDTTYDLPEKPFLANVKKDAEGNIESMHMRVFNSKGLATWVYVAGDNVPKVETAYRVRGPEAVTLFNNAVENTVKETARRNVSVDGYKAKQSKQRRKEKRANNNAPFVSDQGQRAVESAPDFRATRIGQPDTPRQLVEEVRLVAAQLGLDPEVFTNDSELFQMVAPDMAAGLDLESFSPQQRARAVQNLQRNGNNPETLLEYLVSQEAEPVENRIARANQIAALRARNINQIKKHGIRPGADTKTVLQNIAKTATNKEQRQAAKELLRLGADAVPVAITSLPNNLEMAGAYLPQSNAVIVNLASDNSEGAMGALLHELGHAVTDRVLTNPQNDFEQQTRERILGLRAELSQRATEIYGNNIPADLRYALEGRINSDEPFSDANGAREMVAHYYGSKTFRDHLVRLTNKGERSFVQKFIDLIASIFSGQPTASKQYRDLVRTITDLSKANQNLGANPYGRTAARVAASRAAVNQQNRVGTLFGVPNPHSRDDLEWILHQVQTLRYSDLTNEQINDLVKTQRFGMLTGENPNDTQFSDKENIEFNKNAVKWLREKGYPIIPIVGKYNRGENSFLVVGLTDQDAVDAAQELNQDSVVTNTGMYFRTGMVSPRVSEVTDEPIGEGDNYFSALLDTNGNVTTIRVEYDLDTTLDSGIRYSKQDQQAAPTTQIARSLAAQGEFQVVEDRESTKPISFSGGRITVNPTLAEQRYAGYDADDAADFQELDTRLAVAVGIANETNGPELQLDFEEFGLSPDAVIEQAAYNTLTSADLQDLLRVKEQAKQFVASAYYHIAIRNDGSNERLATAQNHIADLYRYLLRDGEAISEVVEGFDPSGAGPITTQIAERAKPLQPIVRYSRAAVDIKPDEVRARTKAGKAVGTRNPTSAKATEDGADPNNLVDLATLKRNPQAYRKNALLLLEYPIVAREFPELAKEYAKIRGAVLKAQDKAKANGIKIKGEKDSAKKILANYLGVSKAKVSGKMLEDAIENPESVFVAKEQPGTAAANKEVRERNKALAKFNKNVERIKKYAAEGVKLGTDSSTALKTYTDTLDKISKDPNHPIATRADEIYDTLIEVTKSNLRALMDVFPADLRDIANLWYDGANIIAQQFAGDNYSLEQSSAVLAVFSPQKDWFQNVELAKRTMEIWTEDQDYAWDDAMSARWLMRGGEPELKENKDGTVGYAKGIKPDLDENGEHRTDENGMLLFHGWSSEKVKAKRQQAFERLQSLKGKKLKELTPEQQAWFIRMRAETKYPTSYPIVSPDGRFGKPSTSTNNKGVTKEIKLAWGTYGSIGKAINILTAPPETQMKVISDELGDQHKVRSFYNNIVDPQNNDGHVTMDTHAIAALFWQAFSGNSREVSQNFGTANTATDSLTGVGGLYPAFAEAYRQVAANYGMLPRQVQSITWEAVRMLFTAKWKSKSENVNGVRAEWAKYQNNEVSLEQVQNAVFAMATNGKDLATAIANSNDEQLGLGFPSWADVTEGPAPAGVALSRAATQLDADYMKAFDAGNTAEMQRIVDEAAKAAGYNIRASHQSMQKGITQFNRRYRTEVLKMPDIVDESLIWFKGPDAEVQYGRHNYEVYLKQEDPMILEGGFRGSAEPWNRWAGMVETLATDKDPDTFVRHMQKQGWDGVQMRRVSLDGDVFTVYGVFDPQQIKSADPVTYDDNGNVIPPSQRFDLAKPDIRYSRAATQLDSRYLELAKDPKANREELQLMVEETAAAAGAEKLTYTKDSVPSGYYIRTTHKLDDLRMTEDALRLEDRGEWLDLIESLRGEDLSRVDPIITIEYEDEPGAFYVYDGNHRVRAWRDELGVSGNSDIQALTFLDELDPVTYDDNGNVIPLSQRFDLAKPDIRYSRAAGADTAPKAFRGRTVQLTHWSKATELKQTDPAEHGNGGAGKELERRREYGDIYTPRTYFGYGKYRRETQVGVNRYSMLVDGDSLYDLDRDPLDLYPGQDELQKAGYARFDKRAALTLFEKAIKDAGYKGYVSTSYQAGVLFQKQKVTKVKDGDTSLPLAAPGEPDTTKKPRYSKALYAISSPDPESSYMVSVDDLYINNVTGEWDAGNGVVSRLFRAAGDIDPRMFEASKYQERGLRLAKIRLKDMAQAFKKALKKEPNADLDDVNLALGSTEPTVSAAQRSAAESVKKAQIDAANAAFDTAPANAAYAAAVQAARVNYASHRDKAKYTAEVQQAREARKNSPEMAAREVAIAAAEAKYNADIQAARRSNLKGLHAAQAQAQLRLEQNSPETAKAVAEMRVAIDRLSSQLSAELGTNDPLRAVIDQNIGIYLTRSYKIHQEEGYAQRILEDSEFAHQRAQARVFFEKQWVRDTYERWRADVAYEPYTDAEVMALVRQEARDKDVGTRALNDFVDRHGSTPKTFSRAMTRTDLTRFMQKGEVPAELRPILGEIQNPFENALRTYGNLAQFLGTQRLLNQYAKLGVDNGWLVPAQDVADNPDKYRGYEPLVNTTDTKGGDPLAEYYAEPDVVEAFQTMFAPPAPANRSTQRKLIDGVINIAGRAIGASMGALTLGSASFFVRNITGILSFVTANGFIPSPSNINASRLAIKQIYGKNLEGLGADMVMLGVAEGSMTSQAMRDFMRGVIDDPDVISNQIESTIRELGTPGSALLRTLKKSKAAVDALATLNDQIDLFYKAMYFAHEVDVQTKANKHRAVPYTPQQIKQEAARTVRLTTQGRERVAPIFKEFGRSGLGMLFNSFFRFTAEIFRLPASTVQLGVSEYKSGNPVLKARGIKRLMGLGAGLAMTHGAAEILKSMYGVDDDEEETVRASQPPYGRDGNLFITVNENEGTLSTWDLTYTNPLSPISDPIGRSFQHIVRGDWEKVPGTIFKSLANSFLSPQIAVEAVGQAFYNVDDYGRPLWLESDPFTYKAQKFLKHVAGNAYKLRTPTQFWKAYQAYTNGGVYDKDARFEKTSDLLVNEFMPFRIQTHKFEQTALKAFRTAKAELDKGRAALSVFGSYEDLDQQRVDDAYERYDKVQASVNQKLYDYSNGLMGFGLSYSELEKLAYEVGISKRRFEQAVRYKRYERYMPSKDALKGYEKAGGENNGAARVQFIRGAVYSRPQYTPLND